MKEQDAGSVVRGSTEGSIPPGGWAGGQTDKQ